METMLAANPRVRQAVRSYLPEREEIDKLTNFFSIFGDGTRIKILSALGIARMCVTDLANALSMNQTTVSHQLRILKSVGAVRSERVGKIIFYSIADEKINEIMLWGVEFLGY